MKQTYRFNILPAPYFKRYGKLPAVMCFVDGITAVAIIGLMIYPITH